MTSRLHRATNSVRQRTRTGTVPAIIVASAVAASGIFAVQPAAAETPAVSTSPGAHSGVAVDGYDKNQVMMVDGKPYFYNGIQIRADKLRTQLGFEITDTDHSDANDVERIFKQAHDAGYNTVNAQLLWSDLQPDAQVYAVKTATISGNGKVTWEDGSSDAPGGDTQNATSFGTQYVASDGANEKLGYIQFHLPNTVTRSDAAKIRIYVNSGGNGTKEFASTSDGKTTQGTVFNHNLKVYPVSADANGVAGQWKSGGFTYDGKTLQGRDGQELPGATWLPSYDSVQRAYFYDIDVSKAVAAAVASGQSNVRFLLASSTPDAGWNDAASGQPNATWADAAAEPINIIAAGSPKDDRVNSDWALTHRAVQPDLFVSDQTKMDWSTYDALLSYAAKYDLKLEVLWFGSDTTGQTADSRVPYYVLHDSQMTVKADGVPLMVKAIGDPTQLYTYLADPADHDLMVREGAILRAISDHTAASQYRGTLVGYQLQNEPHIGQLSNSATGSISGVPYSRSAVSVALRDKWITDGTISGESAFPTYLLWTYDNYLGQQVKESSLPVWTRVNQQQNTSTNLVPLNEQKRATTGTNIDFAGMDSYQTDPGGLFMTGHGLNRTVNVYQGENLPMVMENGGSENNVDQQTFSTIAGGSVHNVYDACSLDTHNLFDLNAPVICDENSTRVYKRQMTYADKISEVASTNKLLNKVGYDLATRNSDALAGSTLQFFNPTFNADANTSQITKGQVSYAVQKYAKYGYSWQSAGFAIERAKNELALGTTFDTTFRLKGLAGKIESVELGSYDDPNNDTTDNKWIRDADASYMTDGNDVVVTVPKGDVARIMTTGDDIAPVPVVDEHTFEAENSKISSSDSVARYSDDASGTWDKLLAPAAGSWVSYKVTNDLTGNYDLTPRFREGPDRGIVQVSVDGVNVGEPLDLYNATPGTWASISVPVGLSSYGAHTVKFTVVGKNPASTGYSVGIDFLTLKKIEAPDTSAF